MPKIKKKTKSSNVLKFSFTKTLKRKNSRTAAPFWPQRDMRGVGSRVNTLLASGLLKEI